MILVFVGAGGSAAVDLEQYPTTVGFFKSLPGEIANDPLFLKVYEFLKGQQGKEIIDIEDVLGILGELQETFKKMNDPTNIVGWAMKGRLGLIEGVSDFANFQGSIATWERNQITPLKDKINAQVYKFYGIRPAPEKLSAWIRLLKGLKEIGPAIEIFTTNYDRVLEDATKQADMNMEYGVVHDGLDTYVDYSLWGPRKRPLPNNRRGLLTKLHGSVDWQRLDGNITRSAPRFTGDHQNHCILYPGHKGTPTEEPFISFHEHLRTVVRGEYEPLSAAIFIGFAFRDDHINTILSDLPSEPLKYVITKSDGKHIDDIPPENAPASFRDNCLHGRRGFTEETAEDCLGEISAATGRPLDS